MGKRVIVVDDSKFLVREIVQIFSTQMQFEVVAIGYDGLEAVELYRKHRPDLITLDLTMPNKDGKAAIDEILLEFPEARILVISAIKGNLMVDCLKQGVRGYIEKPLKFSDPLFLEDFKASVLEAIGS